jgi:hypothetical protein
MGIDDESSHPELCSEVAGGVTRTIVCLFREPDAGNLPVRFDEREQETEPSQTGQRRRRESFVNNHRETKSTAPVLDSLSSFVVGTVSELETEQKSGPKFKAGCDRPECCVAVKPARPTTDGSIPLV